MAAVRLKAILKSISIKPLTKEFAIVVLSSNEKDLNIIFINVNSKMININSCIFINYIKRIHVY